MDIKPLVIEILKNTRCNFDVLECSQNKKARHNKSKIQENMLVECLRNTICSSNVNLLVYGMEDFCKLCEKKYNYMVDSSFGDIVITDGVNRVFIDLKVSEHNQTKLIGSPTVLSIVNFSAPNHLYLLCNSNGTERYIVESTVMYKTMIGDNRVGKFMCTRRRMEPGHPKSHPEVQSLIGKIDLVGQNGVECDTSVIDDDDFVTTPVIRNLFKKL